MTRLAITTPRDAATRAAAPFSSHGFDPVILPCIEVAPAEDRVLAHLRREAERADWLLITSTRAVSAMWPHGDMPAVAVAAVGDRTAAAVTRAGGHVRRLGRSGVDDLIDRLEGSLEGRRVAYPHSSEADRTVIDRLEAAAATVAHAIAYRVIPIPPDATPVDAVAFASPSAVEGWCSARPLDDLLIGAIGPTTARMLEGLGRPADAVPDPPGFDGLAAMMASHLSGRRAR